MRTTKVAIRSGKSRGLDKVGHATIEGLLKTFEVATPQTSDGSNMVTIPIPSGRTVQQGSITVGLSREEAQSCEKIDKVPCVINVICAACMIERSRPELAP